MTYICLTVIVGGWTLFWIQVLVQMEQVYAVVVSLVTAGPLGLWTTIRMGVLGWELVLSSLEVFWRP